MRISIIYFIIFCFWGCSNSVSEKDLNYLNGYWEIEKVTFKNGTTKTYAINATIDYISLEGMKGFRKKMQPKFDGSYETSNDAIPFILKKKEGIFEIEYKYNTITQQPIRTIEFFKTITEDNFSITDMAETTYFYKRYQPIDITE